MSRTGSGEITTQELLEILQGHSLEARLVGRHRGARKFCSLRAPESSGIYYVTGEMAMPEGITESIIISSDVIPGVDIGKNSLIVTAHPQLAFYLLQEAFTPREPRSGVHSTAVIGAGAVVDPGAWIGPYCVVGDARIGPGCVLESHVVIRDRVTLERDVTVESHSTLGATGVAWVWDVSGSRKVVQPQTGGVRVGEGTFIGTDVTVVRGSINDVTSLGAHCLIAHGTKIGHGCRISDLVHFANNVTLGGSVTVGSESFLGSGCVIRPHVRLPKGTTVGAGAVVIEAPEREYATIAGVPAKEIGSAKAKRTGVPERPAPVPDAEVDHD